MLKNRFLAAFAVAGLVGFAACAEEEPEVIEEPVVEEPIVAPTVESTPTMTDTAGMQMDTGMAATDTTSL